MPREEITSAVVGGNRYEVGQRVCVEGRGTAATLHQHGAVARFTKTLMIVKTEGSWGGTRRYRIGEVSGLEVGSANGYGGTYVHPRCHRPKKG